MRTQFFPLFLVIMIMPKTMVSAAGAMRGHLYSTAALKTFCSEAQQVIATTNLNAQVDLFDDLDGFLGSDVTPYKTATDLPLVTPGYLAYAVDENDDKEYVQGILCKLKSADGLNDAYGAELGAVKTDCSTINEYVYDAVRNSLTKEQKDVVFAKEDIVFDTWNANSGPQWTQEAPTPFAYTKDNQLHLVGKELYVDVNNPLPFVPVEKKGVDYCQVPSAVYLRKLLTGKVDPPECDEPPSYPSNPFEPLPVWNCENL